MASPAVGLHDLFQQLKSLVYGIWRKRWYMMATTWLICLLGWGLVSTLPYKYESSAQIFVDTDTILPSIVRGIGIDVDVSKKIDVVRKTLVTRPNLEKIIRRSEYLERLARNDAELNSLVINMQDDILVASLGDGMYRIQYEIDDARLSDRQRAEVAKNVVNNLLSFFLESGSSNSGANKDATEFLDKRIADYAERLSSAETAHAKFKQDNIEFIGGQGSFLSRHDSANESLRKTRNEIAELNVSLETLQEQIQNVPATIREARSSRGGRGGGEADPLEERISDLEKKIDQLRTLGFTDRYPDIVNIKGQLEVLRQEQKEKQDQIAAELSASAEAGKKSNYTTETPNRLYEQLMLNIITTTTQVKSLQQRELDQRKTVAEMEEKAKRVPEIEAQEAQLKRDFEQLRRQYNLLLKEQQDLELRSDVEGADEAVSLRVVEPPNTPTAPSGPPRLIFLSLMLVGGLIAGIGAALVLSLLRPVVLTVDQLRLQFDLNILGNVSRSLSEEETRQRSMELLFFAGATAALFVVFAGFVAFDMIGGPI
ncbi:XrtA system polysaccharide chain length determinant [Kordiimonas aquimaris]|uniref:XrtA system polysaccharide chain length determinant n=1 Tax=Kordiimonas aquimaris TaxID=707591 RepID=UPI0021CFE000|nr:XrtA system polysaccharide chain length determinant [Kordiimonas aquimaris]